MSGTEGQEAGGTVPIDLQLPRGATGSGREQSTPQPTAPVTRLIDTKSLLQVTPYHGDKDSNLSVVNSESLLDIVIGVGESAMKKPSVGSNKST